MNGLNSRELEAVTDLTSKLDAGLASGYVLGTCAYITQATVVIEAPNVEPKQITVRRNTEGGAYELDTNPIASMFEALGALGKQRQ